MNSAEERKKHLAAAKRWHSRMPGARRRYGERDARRCHEKAMEHLYASLGAPKKGPLL
jgi:hypothetical protein